jgi:hypothetical protein
MPELKLAKLPDRVPVKITITFRPDLFRLLGEYAEQYNATYATDGDRETVAELIPFMLQSFIESDRGFQQALKERARDPDSSPAAPAEKPIRRRRMPASPSIAPSTTPLE